MPFSKSLSSSIYPLSSSTVAPSSADRLKKLDPNEASHHQI